MHSFPRLTHLLLDHGTDVSCKDNIRMTPLLSASLQPPNNMVRMPLGHWEDVSVTNEYGATPVHLAARLGHRDMTRLLLSHGANFSSKDNTYGRTPLHWAAISDDEEIVRLLRVKQAGVLSTTNKGRTGHPRASRGPRLPSRTFRSRRC